MQHAKFIRIKENHKALLSLWDEIQESKRASLDSKTKARIVDVSSKMKTFDFYADKPVILKTIYINKNDRLPKEIFFIPPILVFILIYLNQHRRRNKQNRAQNEKK